MTLLTKGGIVVREDAEGAGRKCLCVEGLATRRRKGGRNLDGRTQEKKNKKGGGLGEEGEIGIAILRKPLS